MLKVNFIKRKFKFNSLKILIFSFKKAPIVYKILAEYLKLPNGIYLFNLNVIDKRRYELIMEVSF